MTYILTLQLDPACQLHFNLLRQQHFPANRNFIDAHLTLFHNLPEDDPSLADGLAAASAQSPFPVSVTGLRSLGKGVAYTLTSPPLQTLHRRLATAFAAHLTPQDRQAFHPHIVVQNKVTPAAARILLDQLRTAFSPMQLQATGLALWHYRGGPWELAEVFAFQEIAASATARESRTRSGSPTPL